MPRSAHRSGRTAFALLVGAALLSPAAAAAKEARTSLGVSATVVQSCIASTTGTGACGAADRTAPAVTTSVAPAPAAPASPAASRQEKVQYVTVTY